MAEQESGRRTPQENEQPPTPDDALGYEHARDALLEVVRQLETGGTSLEESLALWERGEQLAKVCQRWLDGARARLDAALAAEETGGSS
ncbi:exodeoxyribonuclease VII small subunit [Kitasatospora sp. NBC_00315]|uniref:exodeoxyribonuclease VII small subunit n=1 Tax=Kitasatospora sp. NBC_00315 TaxID=2975963 RepID=UPI003247A0F6